MKQYADLPYADFFSATAAVFVSLPSVESEVRMLGAIRAPRSASACDLASCERNASTF
jgi:hypothetical protein